MKEQGLKKWVVDPAHKTLTVFILGGDGTYARGVVYAGKDILKTALFEGLEIKMEEVFEER